MAKKTNVVPVRFSDEELQYIKDNVDYFYCDTVSDVIRRCVRLQMRLDKENLEEVK